MSDKNELGNDWGTLSEGTNGQVPDELTLPNKAEVMNYVYEAVKHYTEKDRKTIAMLANAVNVLLACLENGIPVKGGKVTLGPEEMHILSGPQFVN